MTRRPYDHDELAELRVLEPGARTPDALATATRVASFVVLVLACWGLVALLVLGIIVAVRLAT